MRHTLTIAISLLLFGAFSHAQNSNDEIHIRATVQAVVPLTSFSGQATSVDVDPRFALTVHVESVIPAVSNFPEGAVVTLAIHSPTLLFAGEPTRGKTYNFSVHRTLEGGNTKFLDLTVDSALSQLERFLGTWEIRKSPATGRVNLTVNIIQGADTIGGTVTFLNPDGTTTQWPITHTEFRGITQTRSLVFNTEFKGPRLDFQTLDHDAIMYWSLTITNTTRGFLRGDEHELAIEEKVKKNR
ncbi:MAG TPA: hypothetical protein VE377_19620 [Candidatus Dormibacteraeota bacterium]|nr:hypothetical protein [Candidatus Dormibacteraeota bacterium]